MLQFLKKTERSYGTVDAERGVVYIAAQLQTASPVIVGSYGTDTLAISNPTGGKDSRTFAVIALAASDGTPLWGVFPLYTLNTYFFVGLAVGQSGVLLASGFAEAKMGYTNQLDAPAFSTPITVVDMSASTNGMALQIRVSGAKERCTDLI